MPDSREAPLYALTARTLPENLPSSNEPSAFKGHGTFFVAPMKAVTPFQKGWALHEDEFLKLVPTGLSLGESASITVGNLELDGTVPYIVPNAADET